MQVVFSHGKESGPWGGKITALAQVARAAGLHVESLDYRGMDDPGQRVTRLLEHLRGLDEPALLVGSSMGGHVAAAAAGQFQVRGLFLMAPAFYMGGYEALTPPPPGCPVCIVHGWHDEVVPVDNAIRYARQCACALHLLDSDHRLMDRLDQLCGLFRMFLAAIPGRAGATPAP